MGLALPSLLEESEEIFGWNWAIMPRVPGISLVPEAGHQFPAEERWNQAASLGAALAALHTVTMETPAAYDRRRRGLEPLATPYGDYAAAHVRRLLRRCRQASPATTDADVSWVESVVSECLPAFEEPFTPCVVHLDYSENNAVLARDGGRWRVAAVVDWMTAEVGHPEADLCRSLAHYRSRDASEQRPFLEAYRAVHPEAPGFSERFPLLMLWERLLIWEYGQRNTVWFPRGLTLRRWAEPFLNMSPGLE